MFQVIIRTLNANEEIINTAISGSFAERKEAVGHLNRMVKDLKAEPNDPNPETNAGYDAKQDYWWTRQKGVVSRYTIEA